MTYDLLILAFLVIATERITEIIVESKLFEPVRKAIKRYVYPLDEAPVDTYYQHFKVMLDYLSTCGYCVSVWVGYALSICAPMFFSISIVNWFIMGAVIHGLSNLYHAWYELVRRGRVHTHDIAITRKKDGE
jgi:hypothetical protein